jgi:hypothetical protein
MQERLNLAISAEELKSLLEQSKGTNKEPSSLERIQFAIDTQTLKALIEPKGISNVRPLPPVERINFSISKKELESLISLTHKKIEQKKKKEEQLKEKPSQIQIRPQQNSESAGQRKPAMLVFIGIMCFFFLLIATGMVISTDSMRLLWTIHVQLWSLLEDKIADIEMALMTPALVTISLYHIIRTPAIFVAKKKRLNAIPLAKTIRTIGIINGISVSLIFIVPVVYLYFYCYITGETTIIHSNLQLIALTASEKLKGSLFYILIAFLTILAMYLALIISKFISKLCFNFDWLHIFYSENI